MALPARTKTYILLVVGVVVLAIVLVPLHFHTPTPLGISGLNINTRAALVERYERAAREFGKDADSLHKALLDRYGMTQYDQDSILTELQTRATMMLQITGHLRNPEKETPDEKTLDISAYLQQLSDEAQAIVQEVIARYLQ
jgi:hypothetical protein